MTRRPMLILNGKPRRYGHIDIFECAARLHYGHSVLIDDEVQQGATVSYSTRPSGRRMIYVDVPEVE